MGETGAPREGTIEVPGGRVWYALQGEGGGVPVLLLHGGPGATSYYLEPLARLSDERPVVFYDQLGCGRSERPEDEALWSLPRFVDEVASVREALGLEELHLYGHSWGTILAVECLRAHGDGIRSLVLASPALSIPRWLDDANELRRALPEETRETLARHEASGTTDSSEYMGATMEFYQRHLCRLDPWPEPMELTHAHFGWGVYHHMWGPSEFHATGTLQSYDGSEHLRHIDRPVLYTAGRHDEATPDTTAWYQSLTPGAELEVFEDSSHMTMLEVPDPYCRAIGDFLREVDADGARG